MKQVNLALLGLGTLTLLSGCDLGAGKLGVTGGDPVTYLCEQNHKVQVHYFSCRGTLEEKIEELIKSKRAVADSVVGSGENWLTELSDEELSQLFTLSSDAVEDIK